MVRSFLSSKIIMPEMSCSEVRSRCLRFCSTNGNSAKEEMSRHIASGEAHTNVKQRWLALDDVSNASFGNLLCCIGVADMRLIFASMRCSIEFSLALLFYSNNPHIVSQKHVPKRLCPLFLSPISKSKRCFSMAGTSFCRPTCMRQQSVPNDR
jgi:hypothetical protein